MSQLETLCNDSLLRPGRLPMREKKGGRRCVGWRGKCNIHVAIFCREIYWEKPWWPKESSKNRGKKEA